ncbi:MAG: hypothetical protein IGS03_16410 [Candidatus Sericytochromatia bacterium]|nr:hypothetical protein [Candidatus Sericytochromatia bacterium]
MSFVQPQGMPHPYAPPPPQYGAPPIPHGSQSFGPPGYANDIYRPTGPYQTGYVQGATAAYGASSSISSAASGFANIFSSLTNVIAKVLNAIVSVVVKVFKGILGIFGIGKKKPQQPPPQMMPQPMPGGAQRPGMNMPQPPPGTDVNQARQVVKGDLQHVQDPGTAFRHIDLHAKKALDNRRHAEDASRHAETLAQEAAVLAQRIEQSQGRMHPQELNQTLSQLEIAKTQAMEALKRAEEFTKATYDEALYAHLAMEELLPRFPQVPALAQDAQRTVGEGWQAWTTGVEETQYLFMKKRLPPAPEVFTRAVGTVNAHLNQVDQVLGRIMIRR